MTTTYKTADELETGKNILNGLAGGAGVGMGGMALYHLLRAMKPIGKKEKRYSNMASGTPMPVEKGANHSAGDVYNAIAQAVGSVPGRISDTIFGPMGMQTGSGPAAAIPNWYRDAFGTAASMGAIGGGLYGGAKLVNNLVQRNDRQEAEDEVEAAKKRYYAILSGNDKAAAALDAAFEKFAEPGLTDIGSALWNFGADAVPRALTTTQVLASLGAAGLGAKYMYDRTAERTKGENLAKAQASRARMSGLPDVYIDPEQLAQVKQLAEHKPHE